jgi:Ca2+-binding RTX toxin-like protein
MATISGGSSYDTVVGTAGSDHLFGQSGDDTLEGGDGADFLNGGNGVDYASYVHASSGVRADLLYPELNIGEAVGDSYASIENIVGGNFNDTLGAGIGYYYDGNLVGSLLHGGPGADLLIGDSYAENFYSGLMPYQIFLGVTEGAAANDTVYANGGNDAIYGSEGADLLDGGDGIDVLSYYTATIAVMVDLASPANNTGYAAGDTLISIERLGGSSHNDTLVGDSGDNYFDGDNGRDALAGEQGNDTVDGGGDNDTISGGDGNDSLVGGFGLGGDSILGGAGNDVLDGGYGADVLNGGDGFDMTSYAGMLEISFVYSVYIDLGNQGTNGGHAAGEVLVSIEQITGTSYGDTIIGDGSNNVLMGSWGDDSIAGGDGDDSLQGNQESDTLRGGLGNDELRGGQEHDVIFSGQGNDQVFGALGNDELRGGLGNDTISAGQGNDSLFGGADNDLLQGRLGNDTLTGGAGTDMFWFNASGTADADTIMDFVVGTDKIQLDSIAFTATTFGVNVLYSSGALSYDADGAGGGSAVLIATLVGLPALTANDILAV